MLSSPLRRRARLLLCTALAAAIAVTGLAAAPASAQVIEPVSDVSLIDPDRRFDAALAALLQVVYRAEHTTAEVELIPAAQVVAEVDCVQAGPVDADVPTMVAEIFRCRLLEAGVDEEQSKLWAAEALVVSHCESLWDTTAVVFGGKYLDRPHPNGNRYSAAGVFQFIRATAEKWIEGGYANVHDARLNIDAAARLFIHNRSIGLRGWDDWACAAANDGFKVGSVLPGWAGGPAELPDWAWEH